MDGMKNHKNSGFTLVEIIVVMLIVAIIGTVVASRYTGSNENELSGQLAVIKSHLRYAQAKAMGSTSPDPIPPSTSPSPLWYIRFQTTPAEYALFKDGSKTFFPGEKDEDVTLKPGISLSGSTYISFDYLGRPYPNMDAIGTQLTTVKTIVTSSAGNVEIKPETGFIH